MTENVPEAPAEYLYAANTSWAGLLPSGPARLLLLAEAPEIHANVWKERGYEVCQSTLNQPGDCVQHRTDTRHEVYQVEISGAEADASSCHAALILDLSPRVHPLALFDQLAHWLVDDATVVLAGRSNVEPPPRMRNWLDYVVAIGTRCGFTEEECADHETGLDANRSFVRVLRRTTVPRWQLRHVRREDFGGISTLFQEVFGHPLSRELWNWKYGQGRGNAVVAARHGVLIAHYGGMYREVLLRGKPDWVFQICDVMVHPKERGVMTRQGPFLLTAATSAEIYGPLGFGFPNSRAMLVAEKMGLYSEVGQMVSVRWEPSEPGYRWRTRARALVRHDPADQARVETLWRSMAHDLREDVVGVRDWQYLENRYYSHPHNQYELLLVTSRWTGRPLGVVVLRRVGDSCELLDVVAPLANIPLLIDQARRVTGLWGLASVYCWITKNQVQHFSGCDGKEEALSISIPTSCWTDDPRADVFKDRWWLMSGDTDFR